MSEDMLNVMGSFSETALDCIEKQNEEIQQLQQENQQLKEKVGELTNSWNEQIKLTNQENLDCSKYAVENHHLKSVLDEIREYINNYDVFKEFSFPLMKRDEENQVKSSIDYEFQTSIKKSLLQILDKVKE